MDEGCDVCGEDHATIHCPELGLQNSEIENVVVTRARLTLPHFLQAVDLTSGEVTVYATETLRKKSQFGPYEAKKTTHEFSDEGLFVLKIMAKDGTAVSLDTTEESECNWMCLVQSATCADHQNLIAYQLGTSIYYSTVKDIAPGTELRVWYAPQYAKRLGKSIEPDGYSKVMLGMKVVYPSVEELAESQTMTNAVEEGKKNLNPTTGEITLESTPHVDSDLDASQDQMDEIENANTIIANFHCRRCGEGFMTEIELGKHIREHINPPGSGRKGRLPKAHKLNKLMPKKKRGAKTDNEDSEENDFQPKPYQIIKEEPVDSPRLRILPRRSLKGKRTTGFLVDDEFLLTKNQIKTEPEEVEDVHVATERKDHSQIKRKRGRPRTKGYNETNIQDKAKRQNLFNNIKQKENNENSNKDNIVDESNETSSVPVFKDKITGKTFTQQKAATFEVLALTIDSNMEASTVDSTITENNNDKNEEVLLKENIVVNAVTASTENGENTLSYNLELTEKHDEENFDPCSIEDDKVIVGLGDDLMEKQPETNDSNKVPESDSDLEVNKFCIGNTVSSDPTASFIKDTLFEDTGEQSLVLENNNIENLTGNINENLEDDIVDPKSKESVRANQESEESVRANQESEESVRANQESAESVRANQESETDVNNKGDQDKFIENANTDSENIGQKGKKTRKKKSLPIPMEIRETPNGKEYLCTVCNKKFNTERYLRLHAPMHTSEFQCDTCDKTFARKESLQKHECRIPAKIIELEIPVNQTETEVPGMKKVYHCSSCEETFEEYTEAERHLSKHRKGFECEHCNQMFVKRIQYNQHICPNIEKQRYSCDICSQTFGNEQSLFRHIAMHTDIYKCENCEKCFSRKDSLMRHVTKCCPEKADEYGVFSCRKCSKTFGTKLGLENHEANCNMHLCEVCLQVFDSEANLTDHKCNPPTENGDVKSKRVKFSCTDCNKSFRNLHYLLQHKQVHCNSHGCKMCGKKLKSQEERDDHERFCIAVNGIKLDGKISCDRCGMEFYLAKEYKEHYQTHTHTYHCDKCDKRFVKIGTLHNHQCIPSEGFKCDYCKREFKSQKFFQNHMALHSDFLSQCSKCNQFFELDAIDEHVCESEESVAEGSAKYVCHFCGKYFVSTSNLNKHMKVHGEKNIECEFCGKKFHYPEYLKVHIAGVHEKKNQFQCSECGKILTSKPGLVSHMKLFHAENKDVYPCLECGKCFSQKGNMKTHMFSHGKERTFQCPFCPKAFKYPDQLNRHKLSHTLGNKFQCEICEKTFVKDYELRKHIQANHSNKMYVCEFCSSRCGHRHTVQRHYRRKHPASAHLVENSQYVDSLFQEVDLDSLIMEKGELIVMEHTAQIQQPNGVTVTVPIEVSQSAAEALSSLSAAGNTHTVISHGVAQLISQDGTIVQIPGQENMFTIPASQEDGSDHNQQTVVILQIVNQQDQQIEVAELETHVIDSAEIETISQDFQYTTDNILNCS